MPSSGAGELPPLHVERAAAVSDTVVSASPQGDCLVLEATVRVAPLPDDVTVALEICRAEARRLARELESALQA